MKGYNYLVRCPLNLRHQASFSGNNIITVDTIWDCCSNSGDEKTLKDLPVLRLVSVFKRRYYGWACAEANLPKTQDFVFKGLLPTENDYNRAFRIVEIELGFCYDFFFTKYHLMHDMGLYLPVWILWFVSFVGKIIFFSLVGLFALKNSLILATPDPIIEVHVTKSDYVITLVILGTIMMVELLQAVFYLASNWFIVSLTCSYVHVKQNCCVPIALLLEKLIGFLSRITFSWRWRQMIGQYSVISSASEKLGLRDMPMLLLSENRIEHMEKKQDPVKISGTVKRAIARSLISTAGKLTNGETSLKKNRLYDQYSWTLKDHCQVEVMLIWHIATEYCKLGLPEDHMNGNNREVAVGLSRYCAYLIVFVPELLPYHISDIRHLRIMVLEEASEILASYPLFERYQKMKGQEATDLEAEDPSKMVFMKGVKLGKQLERMQNGQHWKVMADFWAETIIYVAPAHSTAKEHMRHLEDGGEFLTHLWALLSHAGILNLDRDKDQWTKRAQ